VESGLSSFFFPKIVSAHSVNFPPNNPEIARKIPANKATTPPGRSISKSGANHAPIAVTISEIPVTKRPAMNIRFISDLSHALVGVPSIVGKNG
jgi:hypothetical protein